jgi:hypothetical protein
MTRADFGWTVRRDEQEHADARGRGGCYLAENPQAIGEGVGAESNLVTRSLSGG